MESIPDSLMIGGVYAAIFAWTLLDHGGISLAIIAAGSLTAAGEMNGVAAFIVVLFAIGLFDCVMIIFGRSIDQGLGVNRRLRAPSARARVVDRIRDSSVAFVTASVTSVCLFGKLLPRVGEYLPAAVAACGLVTKKNLVMIALGDLMYASLMFALGYWFAESVAANAAWLTVLSVALFGLVWLGTRSYAHALGLSRRDGRSD